MTTLGTCTLAYKSQSTCHVQLKTYKSTTMIDLITHEMCSRTWAMLMYIEHLIDPNFPFNWLETRFSLV